LLCCLQKVFKDKKIFKTDQSNLDNARYYS